LTTPRHQEVYTFLKVKELPGGKFFFYRDEPKIVYDFLPRVRCPVLYIMGGKSEVSTPERNAQKKKYTGNGDNEMITIEEAGHLVPQEEVDKTGIPDCGRF
jgi:pimeloyl-ACP methyl ester carboxylesterase